METKPAVIVINSQVVRGSVGGRASAFVLQRLGFPVWTVPTVTYAWHPGHGPSTHFAPDTGAFAALLDDLRRAPWLGEVGAVLTGYLGGEDQVAPIVGVVEAVKAANPGALYLCDPIIGDVGGLYRPEAVAAAIRDRLLPLADIATPNRYELAWLTGTEGRDHADLTRMAGALGPGEAVITSAFAPPGRIGNLLVTGRETILVAHEELQRLMYGTGDLFSALYLGHRLDGLAPPKALERAVDATRRVIELTEALGDDEMPLAAGQGLFTGEPDP